MNLKTTNKYFLSISFLMMALRVGAEVLVGSLPGDVSVDNMGAANYSIPFTVPPGSAGMAPTLGISYNSRNGNGIIGMGFSLNGLSAISRVAPDKLHDDLFCGIQFSGTDRLQLEGKRLLLISPDKVYGEDGSEYRTEIESFRKVVLHGDMNSSNAWFEVYTKSGLIYEYGHSADAFVEPSNRVQAVTWAVNRISDTLGNYIDFFYQEDVANGEHLIERIEYTGNAATSVTPYNSIEFVYEVRNDTRFSYLKGARFNTTKRLDRVEFYVDGVFSHEYQLDYEYGITGLSRLTSVQQLFANGDSVPSTRFYWTDEDDSSPKFYRNDSFAPQADLTGTEDLGTGFSDLNGDGLMDLLWCTKTQAGAYTNSGSTLVSAPDYATMTYSGYVVNPLHFDDFDGDGSMDVMVRNWLTSYLNLNTNPGWNFDNNYSLPKELPLWLALFLDEQTCASRFSDVNGDGRSDFLYAADDLLCYTNSGSGWIQDTNYTPKCNFVDVVDSENYCSSGVLVTDLNNDKLPDMLIASVERGTATFMNTGSGWTDPIDSYEAPYPIKNNTQRNLGVQLVDVNGDSLPDFIYSRKKADGSTDKGAYLNTGDGWTTNSYTAYEPPLPLKEDDTHIKGIQFLDINGDGLPDILQNNKDGQGAWLNTGNGWVQDNRYAPPERILNDSGQDYGSRFVDINGDGLVDQVLGTASSNAAWINSGSRTMLRKMVKGYRDEDLYESSSELTYSPLTDKQVYTKGSGATFPAFDIQSAMPVVSELSTDNAQGGVYRTIYRYTQARIHRDRGFLGFQIFESYDPQTKLSQIEYLAQDYPLTGVVLKSETRYVADPETEPAGQVLKEIENIWLYNIVYSGSTDLDAYPYFQYVPKSVERKWKLGDTNNVISEVTTYNWFDDQDTSTQVPNLVQYSATNFPIEIIAGNISKTVIDYGGGTRQITESGYGDNYDRWLLGRLTESTNTFEKAGYSNIVRKASFKYYSSHGLLEEEVLEPDSTTQWLKTDYMYDLFGNITNKVISGADILARNEQSNTYYAQGRFAFKTSNALLHTQTNYTDCVTGLVTNRIGPNGLPTSWRFDSLGRSVTEWRADGTSTTNTYAWVPNVSVSVPLSFAGSNIVQQAAYSVTAQSTGASPTTIYFDQKGRKIRTVTQSPSGTDIYQDIGYNSLGQKVAVSDPYFSGDSTAYGFSE